MEEKRHYKLYKSGKNWVVASIAAITVLSGSGLASTALNVHAATPVAAAKSNINFAGLKAQLVWSNAKASNASIYSSATGKTLVAKLQADIKTANGYIANPNSTTQAKVTSITTALKNDGVALNNEVANILNGQLFWSNKKVASDYVTTQGKALFAQLQTQLATANSYVKNPSLATPANVMAITSALHQTGLDLYASKVTDLKAQLVWSNAKKAADYTTEAGKKAFATLTADIKIANGYVADPEFATPAEIATITDKLHQDGLDLIASNAAGDATQLNKDITAVTDAKYVESDYTKDSYAALQTALVAAQKVAADKASTKEAIDAADKALTDAQTALVANPVDATALQTLVNSAPAAQTGFKRGTDTINFTAVSYKQYQAELANAKAVLANTKATQSQVNAEVTAFKAALGQAIDADATTGLQTYTGPVDASQFLLDLQTAKTTYYTATAATQSTDSYVALLAVINKANSLVGTDGKFVASVAYTPVGKTDAATAGQDSADAADKDLTAVLKDLGTQASTNKDALNQAITNVSNTLNDTNKPISMTNKDAKGNQVYTTTSFNAFMDAYNNAKTVAADVNAKQGIKDDSNKATIEGALNTLTASIKGLTPYDASTQLVSDINLALAKIALVGGDLTGKGNKTLGGSHVYTQASFNALVTTLNTLKNSANTNRVLTGITDYSVTSTNLVKNPSAENIAAADKAVNDALNGLTRVAAGTLDKTELQNAINSVAQVVASNNQTSAGQIRFSQLDFNKLKADYTAAKALVSSMTTSQVDIDNATTALYSDSLGKATLTNNKFELSAFTAASDKASSLTEGDYTKDSYAAVTKALATVKADKAIIDGNDAAKIAALSQAQINTDTDALNVAINNLVGSADKSTLEKKIALAQSLNTSSFGAAAVANFNAALAQAVAVDKNPLAIADDKDSVKGITSATTALDKAITDLTSANTVSDAAVDAFGTAKTTHDAGNTPVKYSTTSWTAFDKAYAKVVADFNGTTTITNTTKTIATVSSATAMADIAALTTAANNLVSVVAGVTDTAQLQADINQASQYKASDYTKESFAKFSTALKAAQDALTAFNTNGADIPAGTQANLENEMNNLVGIGKAQLQTALLATKSIAGGNHIALSSDTPVAKDVFTVNTYNNALDQANTVLENSSATQDQITQATTDLKNAITAVLALNDVVSTDAKALSDAQSQLTVALKNAAKVAHSQEDSDTPVDVLVDEDGATKMSGTTDAATSKQIAAYNAVLDAAKSTTSKSSDDIVALAKNLNDQVAIMSKLSHDQKAVNTVTLNVVDHDGTTSLGKASVTTKGDIVVTLDGNYTKFSTDKTDATVASADGKTTVTIPAANVTLPTGGQTTSITVKVGKTVTNTVTLHDTTGTGTDLTTDSTIEVKGALGDALVLPTYTLTGNSASKTFTPAGTPVLVDAATVKVNGTLSN